MTPNGRKLGDMVPGITILIQTALVSTTTAKQHVSYGSVMLCTDYLCIFRNEGIFCDSGSVLTAGNDDDDHSCPEFVKYCVTNKKLLMFMLHKIPKIGKIEHIQIM